EVSLAHIKGVLRSVSAGVNMGLDGTKVDINKALTDALAGMDQALLKTVQANAIALGQLGLAEEDFERYKAKKALDDLNRLEDEFVKAVRQAAGTATERIKVQWGLDIEGHQTLRNPDGSTRCGNPGGARIQHPGSDARGRRGSARSQ